MYVTQAGNPYTWYWAGRPLRTLPSSVALDGAVDSLQSLEQRVATQESARGERAQLCVAYIASHRRKNQGYLIHSLNNLATRAAHAPTLPPSSVLFNVLDAELCKENQHADVVRDESPVLVYRPPVYSELDWSWDAVDSGSPRVPSLNLDLETARANVAHLPDNQCASEFRLQTLDYAYSLYANAHWCKYTLAIEDDAFAARGWDAKTLGVAYDLEGRDPQWLSVKLYYPVNWGADDAPLILFVAVQAGIVFALAVRVWAVRTRRASWGTLSWTHVALVVWGGAVVFGAIRFSSKQALLPLPTGTYPLRNGMVTTAYLFNNANIRSVIKYWRETAHDGEAKDTAYNSYLHTPESQQYTAYMHVPHLFQHVGYNSGTRQQPPISQGEFRTRKMSISFDGEFVL